MTSVADTAVSLMRVLPAPFGLAVGDAAISPAQGAARLSKTSCWPRPRSRTPAAARC